MTLGELLDALAARGSRVAADGGRLRHVGPRFAEGNPVRRALAIFHDEVARLAVSSRLCCFCPRLAAEGDLIACAEHRAEIEETPKRWDQRNVIANGEAEACRNINGVCPDQQPEHFDFDAYFDHYRAEQKDRHLGGVS